MFKEFIDFVWEIWEWVTPVFAVKPDEGGVKVTYTPWRVYITDIGPGLYFKLPLLSHWIVVSTLVDTMQIGPLSLATADGKDFVVVAVLEYHVKNARPMCIEVQNEKAALRNTACATLKRHLAGLCWADLGRWNESIEQAILNDIRQRRANKWGFKLTSFDVITLCKMRSYRHLIDYGAVGGENGEE